jgi:alkylhydroperoxidase/carboxymuconolactone decarboxylase family protein YurZ
MRDLDSTSPKAAGPGAYSRLRDVAPDVVAAYESLAAATRQAGPLDPLTVSLLRLALSAGQGSWRGVHAHARKALEQGATPEGLRHVAALAVPTLGLHAGLDTLRWVDEIIDEAAVRARQPAHPDDVGSDEQNVPVSDPTPKGEQEVPLSDATPRGGTTLTPGS